MALFRLRVPRVLAAAAVAAAVASSSGQAQEPRFRGGTNLVRLDVYVSANGAAVTDLTADDFEVREDNAPQAVTSFEVVHARGPAPDTARVEPSTVGEMRDRVAARDARAFVLFLDSPHVQVAGSYRAANPVAAMLDRVVGVDDLVGVMTPEMSARNMTFSPRTGPIGDMLRASWAWGERGRPSVTDPREEELRACFPDPAIAERLILKRREQKTLRALDDLLDHLEATRDQRTFVFVLTEGWRLSRPDETLAAPPAGATGSGAGGAPGGAGRPDPLGRPGLTSPDVATPSCERERALVALADHAGEFRLLLQRANRANVSFYPIDARGLVVFDGDIASSRGNPSLAADAAALSARQDALRTLADETDGAVVLNTAPERALPRLLTDIGSYYLLGYISTNQKLDGRYRRISVRVTRPGVEVRARPGYLAPTAREVAGATPVMRGVPGSAGDAPAPGASRVTEALSRLPVSRVAPPLYVEGTGSAGAIDVVVELDRTTVARPEWSAGGVVRVAVTSAERPTSTLASAALTLTPGSRVQGTRIPAGARLAAGRYQLRLEAVGEGGTAPLVLTTLVDVPAEDALLGSALRAARRGPSTGRTFESTADARFRRTERLRLDVARLAAADVQARVLNRTGQELALPVSITDTPAADDQPARAVAELALAPLAAGEYVVELTATAGARTETRTYAFRLVP